MDRHGDLENVGAIVLAAGISQRMGLPKQLLDFRGEPLVRRATAAALDAGCSPVVVVTGANAKATRQLLRGLKVREVENEQWQSGLSSSIRAGVAAVIETNSQTDAIVVLLCDQPFVTGEVTAKLIAAYREKRGSIVASSYGDTFGVPALFGKAHYTELMALEGMAGAKQLIQKHFAEVHLVNFPEGAIDIDTPEDLARFD